MCHRLKAHPGFRFMVKFGTGVALSGRLILPIKEGPEKFPLAYLRSPYIIYQDLNLGGTTMLSSLADGSFFYIIGKCTFIVLY